MMVDLGGERGTIEAGEKQMIDNIFEFNNITAEECMTPPHGRDLPFSVEDTPEEIVTLIRESGYSRFPVYEDDLDDIVGVLNTRDYLLNMVRAESPKPLCAICCVRLVLCRNPCARTCFSAICSEKRRTWHCGG